MAYPKYRKPSRKRNVISARSFGVILLIVSSFGLISLQVMEWLADEDMFALTQVDISGNEFVTHSEILELAELSDVGNILTLNTRALESKLESHPLIARADVGRRLPAALSVNLVERKPIALLKGNKLAPIDDSGTLIENYPTEMLYDYPIISNVRLKDDPTAANVELTATLDFLIHLKSKDFRLYSEISEISYSEYTGIYFSLTSGATVYWGDAGSTEKLDNWERVRREVLAQDSTLSTIEYFDARFRNQVVVKPKVQS